MKKAGIATIALFFVGGILWAADFWEKADYTSWSQKDCEQMLTKSPWAFQYVHTNFYRPAANIPAAPGTATDGEGGARLGNKVEKGVSDSLPVHTRHRQANSYGARANRIDAQSATTKDQAEQFVNQPAGNEILFQIQYASRPPGPLRDSRHSELLSPSDDQ